MRFLCLVVAGVVSFATTVSAATTTIDFDLLTSDSTQLPLTMFVEDGYTFGVSSSVSSAAIFDTNCVGSACNGDTDLQPTGTGDGDVSGNVLIIQEAGSNFPDDGAISGNIVLTFNSGTAFRFTEVSAVDDGTFTFFGATGGMAEVLLGSIMIAGDNQTGKTSFLSEIFNIGDMIRIHYSGSGGVDSLVLSPVPIPAAFPLLAGGLGLLGLMGWRRKRNAAKTS